MSVVLWRINEKRQSGEALAGVIFTEARIFIAPCA